MWEQHFEDRESEDMKMFVSLFKKPITQSLFSKNILEFFQFK